MDVVAEEDVDHVGPLDTHPLSARLVLLASLRTVPLRTVVLRGIARSFQAQVEEVRSRRP
jgi:hypothetical protein